MKRLVCSLIVIFLLASFALAGTVYIEGPGDRGEGILPSGPGEFEVKLYVENVSALAGLQAALEFVGSTGPSDAFSIAVGGAEFQGYKIILSSAVFPEVFTFCCGVEEQHLDGDANGDGKVSILDLAFIRNKLCQDTHIDGYWDADVNEDGKINILDMIFVRNRLQGGDLFGFICMEGEFDPVTGQQLGFKDQTITEKTWLMTVTCQYSVDARGTYTIGADTETTVLANTEEQSISFDVIPGSVMIGGAGVFYIEGPDDRGEDPLPPGPGEFQVDVYAENMPYWTGLRAALDFIGPGGVSDAFQLAGIAAYNADISDNRSTLGNEFSFSLPEGEIDPVTGQPISPEPIDIIAKTWLMSLTYEYTLNAAGTYTIDANSERTEFTNADAQSISFAVVTGSVTTVVGKLFLEGPTDRGEGPIPAAMEPFTNRRLTVDVYAQGFLDFRGAQTRLRFTHPEHGDADIALEAISYNEETFQGRFDVLDPEDGIAGFILMEGSLDLQQKTWLYSLTYVYTEACLEGDYMIGADLEDTIVGNEAGEEIPFEVVTGGVSIEATWLIPGDANFDCKVNILDLIVVRNRFLEDPGSGDNWKADMNGDGVINILDMVFVRNRMGDKCNFE